VIVSPSVLIVDDNVALADNIAEILQLEGCATQVANSAEEALTKALARGVTVVVTDYRLPGINGVELIRRIIERNHRIRAVVISAYGDEATLISAGAVGARFLPKPLDIALLSHIVRDAEA
jgi:DNA-binding NtrC family response regulator